MSGLLDDRTPVHELQLTHGSDVVTRSMRRPAYVVPRTVFDSRLVDEATLAGGDLIRHRVRSIVDDGQSVSLDGKIRARVVIGADGAHSLARQVVRLPPAGRTAIAIRGYVPVPARRLGRQVMMFGKERKPSYAWSFDCGDGLANVGYGELIHPNRARPSRAWLLGQLEDLLPGSTVDGTQWRGHHLPLSSWSWQQPDGRILLAGDAANLINPMTGEGIYYAVATGILAGGAAARSLSTGSGATAGAQHRRSVRSLLAPHLRHTALASRLVGRPLVLRAGVRAARRDQQAFDDLVEMGLGRGRITPRLAGGLASGLSAAAVAHVPAGQG